MLYIIIKLFALQKDETLKEAENILKNWTGKLS